MNRVVQKIMKVHWENILRAVFDRRELQKAKAAGNESLCFHDQSLNCGKDPEWNGETAIERKIRSSLCFQITVFKSSGKNCCYGVK
jgi:hypothetical protein